MGCQVICGVLLLLTVVLEHFKAHAKCSHNAFLLPAVFFVIQGPVLLHTSKTVNIEGLKDPRIFIQSCALRHLVNGSYLSDEAALIIWPKQCLGTTGRSGLNLGLTLGFIDLHPRLQVSKHIKLANSDTEMEVEVRNLWSTFAKGTAKETYWFSRAFTGS